MSTTESGRNPESANAGYLGTVSVIERLHCRVRVPTPEHGQCDAIEGRYRQSRGLHLPFSALCDLGDAGFASSMTATDG